MNFVEPFKKRSDIEKLKKYLKENNYRDYILFLIGINTGLRISDLLNLRVKDVLNQDYIYVKHKKTKKNKKYIITDEMIREIMPYLNNKHRDDYLFRARYKTTPICREQACKLLKKACKACGINLNVGTHSLRKTHGYFIHKTTDDIKDVMFTLGQKSEESAMCYIGKSQDRIDSIVRSLRL